MKIFDSHSHTCYSADSKMQAADALKAAKAAGVGLVFTEHLDIDYPGELKFEFNPEEYWKEYLPLRGENLRLGIEVGMEDRTLAASKEFLERAPFDLVIGSLHMVDGCDLYYKESYKWSKHEFFKHYYELMTENIYSHSFIDVLGHIDYISRYAPFENPELEYGSFVKEIDEVLHAVIETDTVMELNTRRLGNSLALKELMPIYTRYHELGGKFVTLGSDAHTADAIGANFKVAIELAHAAKLKIVTFNERKMEICE